MPVAAGVDRTTDGLRWTSGRCDDAAGAGAGVTLRCLGASTRGLRWVAGRSGVIGFGAGVAGIRLPSRAGAVGAGGGPCCRSVIGPCALAAEEVVITTATEAAKTAAPVANVRADLLMKSP